MAEALERHEEMTGADGEPFNPQLHVTLHQVIANQILADDPPETWQTVHAARVACRPWPTTRPRRGRRSMLPGSHAAENARQRIKAVSCGVENCGSAPTHG